MSSSRPIRARVRPPRTAAAPGGAPDPAGGPAAETPRELGRRVAEALEHAAAELGAWQRSLAAAHETAAALGAALAAVVADRGAPASPPPAASAGSEAAGSGRPVRRRASVGRRAAVNLVTMLATAVVLSTIVGAAYSHEKRDAHVSLPAHRLVGVTTDPWHSDEWGRALGGRIDIVANFMAWGYGKSPRKRLAEAQRRKLVPLITWEPWIPRPGPGSGAVQPMYSNTAIARGGLDGYVRAFARELARFDGPVLLRFGHEMNGPWYPWHHDPPAFVAAWRRIHTIFRLEGANNVVFVWAPNLPHGRYAFAKWRRDVRAYWPGATYVDWVGTTMIGRQGKSVPYYAKRVELLRSYRKPVILAETFAVHGVRTAWLPELRRWVGASPWIRAVVWSEGQRVRTLRTDPRRHSFGGLIHDAKRG